MRGRCEPTKYTGHQKGACIAHYISHMLKQSLRNQGCFAHASASDTSMVLHSPSQGAPWQVRASRMTEPTQG